jgi:octaprenyl-diphosphate synthase
MFEERVMSIERLRSLVTEDFTAVNELIINKIRSEIDLIDDLSQHVVGSGGKRLRPLLVLLASHACAYKGKDHITLAATVEFYHTATLLHDDVVDESVLRRGKETANQIWGSKASILVGDYLFTQSLKLMITVQHWPILQLFFDIAHQITQGEIKQLNNRHNHSLSVEDYFEIIKAKTALLFAASASIGALLSNSGKDLESALYTYGLHLGNAFQLIDDALDYCGNTAAIGKNIGDDLADGKATMPLIHALKVGTPSQKKLIEMSLSGNGLDHIKEILEIIKETQAIEFTKDLAKKEAKLAIAAVAILPNSEYKTALIDLAGFAVERDY